MNRSWYGYKKGIMSEDLKSMGGSMLKEGEAVRYKLHSRYDDDGFADGKEYHYHAIDRLVMIRSSELLIKEEK